MHKLIAALLAAAPCVALAQMSPSGETLTLDQAIRAAGGSAPAAAISQAEIEGARAARRVAGLRPNPSLQTEIENVAGSGPYGAFQSAETTVGLSIPLELGGKRQARIAVADAQAGRALLGAALAEADIRQQVTQLYVEAVAAERRLSIARDQFRIAGDAALAARVRVQAGRASPLEEQRANVARLNAEAGVERTGRLAQAARVNLARRIGMAVPGPLDGEMLDPLPAVTQGPVEPVEAAGTLALAAAEADMAVADAGVRLARSQRVPDLTLSPGVRRLEATNDMAALFSISMPIPVFNAGRAAVAQAQAERTRADAQRRLTVMDVEQAITDAQAEAANAAVTARNANGPALAAAQDAARIARIGYREGKFGQLDLLDAERTLAETRIAAVDALAAYHNAKARLERLTAPAPVQGN
ncbi:TolC family protein [Sphingobium sp. Sx8-8]|uniref:TolC family protein n=1 Tax=Sphingobium sp. Sx8-8 TaxID=2933617 RepID=UPI001F56AAF5|nr:TolC family protein [Sphingobium sp. Sx8-8]